jgi:hypothetical protein
MFELAFRPAPFGVARKRACSCDACSGNAHEFDDEEFEEDFDEGEVCPECGEVHELEGDVKLRDIVIDPVEPGVYGTKSSHKNEAVTTQRCKTEHACPNVTGKLRAMKSIDNIAIEYVGATGGLLWGKKSGKWLVTESKRLRDHNIHVLPKTAESLHNTVANMQAAGLQLQAVLSMGSINCRCVRNTDTLSNHSYGDAFDFAGFRLTDGREFLVANTQCDADTAKMMHRANACLRLSFPHVMDYYNVKKWPYTCKEGPRLPEISHWNHMHCDHFESRKLRRPWYMNPKSFDWRFVRVALGLKVTGGLDAACERELKAFAGNDVLDSAAKRAAGLSKLYMREAQRT